MEFEGRSVVVTGGGGALGRALVERLLGLGAEVHVPLFGSDAMEAREGLRTDSVDLRSEDAVQAFYASVPALYASVHLAGGFSMGALVDTSIHEYERLMDMNVRSAWLCAREAARTIKGPGRIVQVAAKPALHPAAHVVTYAMSKAAVAALTQSLAEELAPRGIWVNAIVPSIIDTPANRQAMPDADHDAWPSCAALAETIAYLASPANQCTRGALVPVYGRA